MLAAADRSILTTETDLNLVFLNKVSVASGVATAVNQANSVLAGG